ncbi:MULTISPECIES: restriction endonuclease subunit S [unclassified Tolypothrix]|uniref:restriction endonuclease subunit S n=1 Tax=unclassified Tolypothrix TaxID=2649714 RepID=UPI0005EAA2D0|nr:MULTISPECIES: restriction endonuclease subunit S [unclassified Tolypothrix]BAY91434.1 restriction modification system DNA specificity domain protein [Microchaete diplosiphon NIES-3275]EKF05526.1 putative type I site-specific deoxyribonuclease specificity subunit [Tolypothrix sp. PCC 7601]MBE9086014.1 restriction endonuclease subunit S [Tolypothrix sp. LEGE 11397]UYD25472.1 restriction endonuclease subunit S [Tolypothrix sp. PCC 7712]UYD32287.1 restriction endonuclease subunit S [Tolypothrix
MIQADTLKAGWKLVKFGDVVRLSKDRATNPEAEGIERYVGLEHIDPDDLRIRRWGLVAEGTTFTSKFKPRQVLFGKRRAYQRKVAVADFEGVCSGDIYVFESANPKVLLSELLPFICQTERFSEYAVGTSAGSLSPRTNWASLANFEFFLPPLEEQKRITKLINTVEKTNNELKLARDLAEKLRKSLLINIFNNLMSSGSIELPLLGITTDCNRIKVEQAGSVLMGRQLSPKYKTGLFSRPYLRVANVFDGYIDIKEVYEMDFSDVEFETFKLSRGDILLNEGQSRELVGRSAIYRNDVENCCFQNTLIRFRPAQTVIPEYAHYYFQYSQYTGRFVQIAKQTTSIAHLGVQRFAAMQFPLIDINIQKEIVKILLNAVQTISKLNQRIESAKYIKKYTLNEILKM